MILSWSLFMIAVGWFIAAAVTGDLVFYGLATGFIFAYCAEGWLWTRRQKKNQDDAT